MSFGYGGGDPEAQAAAQNSMTMQPAVLDHLQQVITQGPLAQNTYDPNRSFRENVLDPRAIDQAMGMVGPGSIKAVGTALPALYHGAARRWLPEPGAPEGRFNVGKIGSGEGAGTEGYGGYATDSKRLGQWYRWQYGDPDAPGVRTNPGALYKLQYPGATQEQFLNWREPMAGQSAVVQRVLGTEFGPGMTAEEAYWKLAEKYGGPRQASEALQSRDILGSRFPADEGVVPNATNYSIFDPRRLLINKRW